MQQMQDRNISDTVIQAPVLLLADRRIDTSGLLLLGKILECSLTDNLFVSAKADILVAIKISFN